MQRNQIMIGQYIIVHNRGKWESRKKTENKNTEQHKYWEVLKQ